VDIESAYELLRQDYNALNRDFLALQDKFRCLLRISRRASAAVAFKATELDTFLNSTTHDELIEPLEPPDIHRSHIWKIAGG
jgi:hypothetical protein